MEEGRLKIRNQLRNFKIPKYSDKFGPNDVSILHSDPEDYKYIYEMNEKEYKKIVRVYRFYKF